MKRDLVINLVLIATNCLCVIALVLVLKLLFGLGFTCVSTLTSFHFLLTGIVAYTISCLSTTTPAPFPWSKACLLAVFKVGSLVFSNTSLLLNSVNLFEILRFTVIPMMCFVDFVWAKKTYPVLIYLALAGIVLSSAVTTVSEVHFSWAGCVMGLLCAVTTVLYQCYNNHLQTTHNISAMQLLTYESPFTVAASAGLALMLGEGITLSQTSQLYSLTTVLAFITGILAIGINITAYLILGKTSPVTYQVVGHLKTACILAAGYLMFHQPLTFANVTGTVLAVGFMGWYSYLKLQLLTTKDTPNSNNSLSPASSGSNATEPLVKMDSASQTLPVICLSPDEALLNKDSTRPVFGPTRF